MFKIGVLSRTTASTEGRSNAVLTLTHVISSDFCTLRNLPWQESAGGLELFSCLKNPSRFPSLAWQAKYDLEKRRLSLLRSATWLPVLRDVCFSGLPSKGRLHRCTVSVMGLDRLLEVFNGVNHKPSNGQKINRQPSKTEHFYRQPWNERAKISRQIYQISLNDRYRLT